MRRLLLVVAILTSGCSATSSTEPPGATPQPTGTTLPASTVPSVPVPSATALPITTSPTADFETAAWQYVYDTWHALLNKIQSTTDSRGVYRYLQTYIKTVADWTPADVEGMMAGDGPVSNVIIVRWVGGAASPISDTDYVSAIKVQGEIVFYRIKLTVGESQLSASAKDRYGVDRAASAFINITAAWSHNEYIVPPDARVTMDSAKSWFTTFEPDAQPAYSPVALLVYPRAAMVGLKGNEFAVVSSPPPFAAPKGLFEGMDVPLAQLGMADGWTTSYTRQPQP